MGRARQRIYTPPRHVRPVQRMRSIFNICLIGIGDSCDAVEFLLARHRMNIQVDELRNDFAVTHVTATTHGFEDGSLPTRHTSFYTFIPNQFRRQSRLAEDFGRRFPRKIPYDTHLFEGVGVRDAVFRHVSHRRQIPQHLELVHAE